MFFPGRPAAVQKKPAITAPPVYRPAAPVRAAPAVYRPGAPAVNRKAGNPHATHWPPPAAQMKLRDTGMIRAGTMQAGFAPGVVQRMYSPNMTTSVPNLDTVASQLSASHGYRQTATFAVVNHENADYTIFGQRYYERTNDAAPDILTNHGIQVGIDYVTPDSSEEYAHAEMLAVSEWLKGYRDKPEMIGASRIVCRYCAVVLQYLGITIFSAPSNDPTPNWASPWYLNGQANPLAIRNQIPKYRKKGKDYY